jgi:LysM repeat protein
MAHNYSLMNTKARSSARQRRELRRLALPGVIGAIVFGAGAWYFWPRSVGPAPAVAAPSAQTATEKPVAAKPAANPATPVRTNSADRPQSTPPATPRIADARPTLPAPSPTPSAGAVNAPTPSPSVIPSQNPPPVAANPPARHEDEVLSPRMGSGAGASPRVATTQPAIGERLASAGTPARPDWLPPGDSVSGQSHGARSDVDAAQDASTARPAAPPRPAPAAPVRDIPAAREPSARESSPRESGATGSVRSALESARRKAAEGRWVAAREELAPLMHRNLSAADERAVREELAKIAEQTIFSNDRSESDPLVTIYKIADTDNLQKIGKKFKVPYEIIMDINGIKDARRIRAGQMIKVPNGPFHAKLSKSTFRMDIYLQDTYVRSYMVGLGKDGGTPTGQWRVDNKLVNPTYFPPASADNKKIIAPGDPKNPLGKHWIGLEGLTGEAKGQEGFGIHGTIEPESIGKAASLGCVRMRNEEVAQVYRLLQAGHSLVTINP